MENLAKKELERGFESAKQLRRVIFKSNKEEEEEVEALTTSSAEDLMAKVLDSFTNTLSLFTTPHFHVSASSSHLPANSDESHSSSKSRSPSNKDPRRSSPKKRKTRTHSWEEESKISPKEDGHAWRKYGQKIILNAKHPRNYYRCTRKYDQGCQATKQVQRMEDDPPLYRNTYFGRHTCTNFLNPQMIILDSHDDLISTSTRILSFNNNLNNNSNKNNNNDNTSFLTQPQSHPSFPHHVKNEEDEAEDKCCNNINKQENNNVPSCSSNEHDDYLVSHHDHQAPMPFEFDHDHVDVMISSAAVFCDPVAVPDLDLDALRLDPLSFDDLFYRTLEDGLN